MVRPGVAPQPVYATGLGVDRRTLDELLALMRRPAWMADAACREHPEVDWFPERGESTEAARAVCAGCLVRADCLTYALEHGQGPGRRGGHGVWAGTSARERSKMREGLAAEVAQARARARDQRRRELEEQRAAREERRRHFAEQREALVAAWLEDPSRPARQVAAAVGTPYQAAYQVRRDLEAEGRLEPRTPAGVLEVPERSAWRGQAEGPPAGRGKGEKAG